MSKGFFVKYRDFIEASEEHARSQEVEKFLRDFIAELNPEADAVEILEKLDKIHRQYIVKTEELRPAFMRETQKLS